MAKTDKSGIKVAKDQGGILGRADVDSFDAILRLCRQARVNVLIWGPPGRGKSFLAEAVARELDGVDRVWSVVCPEDSFSAELRGHFVQSASGEWVWHDGPVVRAVRASGSLILDELDKLSPEAMTFLHSALDLSPMTLPSGETVRKTVAPWVCATMNAEPSRLRSEALLSRFPVRLYMGVAPASAYAGLPEAWRDAAARHLASESGDSLRSWYALAALVGAGSTITDAADLVWPGRGAEFATALKLAGV